MSDTFKIIQEIIVNNTELKPESITPTSSIMDELGVDSMSLSGIIFGIEENFGIKISYEGLDQEIEDGQRNGANPYTVKHLCNYVEALVAKEHTA